MTADRQGDDRQSDDRQGDDRRLDPRETGDRRSDDRRSDDRRSDDRHSTDRTDTVGPSTVRDHVHATHDELLDEVLTCADAVATELDAPVTEGPPVATALERRLGEEGVTERLPAVLETAVAATGRTLAAEPVAAPPYVAVTSRGPVLRGTLGDGRLVVAVSVFDVERDPVRYVRSGSTPAEALDVRFER